MVKHQTFKIVLLQYKKRIQILTTPQAQRMALQASLTTLPWNGLRQESNSEEVTIVQIKGRGQ